MSMSLLLKIYLPSNNYITYFGRCGELNIFCSRVETKMSGVESRSRYKEMVTLEQMRSISKKTYVAV